jgi:glycosyltransferase involved in cell wall biosynthesis
VNYNQIGDKMVITFVIDQYGEHSNGTTVAARRIATVLKSMGHEMRIITCVSTNNDDIMKVYTVPSKKVPIVSYLAEKQGMVFADPDDQVLYDAIKTSDVVHIFCPFALGVRAAEMAQSLGVATTTAFHAPPEIVSYYLSMEKIDPLNRLFYNWCNKRLYSKVKHVHCPTEHVKNLLIKNGYHNEFHVISNGVSEEFKRIEGVEKPDNLKDKFVIAVVGRYSTEKRHKVIIKAVHNSKYEKNIQLLFCGKGPMESQIRRKANCLINYPIFEFVKQPELIKILNYSDLYIHAADLETESISCLEAMACGTVPIISNSELSAARFFALTPHNIFEKDNIDDLTNKIEYLYEHEEERKQLSLEYQKYSEQFQIKKCAVKMYEMFEQAYNENKEAVKERAEQLANNYNEEEEQAFQKAN